MQKVPSFSKSSQSRIQNNRHPSTCVYYRDLQLVIAGASGCQNVLGL